MARSLCALEWKLMPVPRSLTLLSKNSFWMTSRFATFSTPHLSSSSFTWHSFVVFSPMSIERRCFSILSSSCLSLACFSERCLIAEEKSVVRVLRNLPIEDRFSWRFW